MRLDLSDSEICGVFMNSFLQHSFRLPLVAKQIDVTENWITETQRLHFKKKNRCSCDIKLA